MNICNVDLRHAQTTKTTTNKTKNIQDYLGNSSGHQTAGLFKGEESAADCQDHGGTKVNLVDHMKTLWETVNFKLMSFELDMDDLEHETNSGGDVEIKDKTRFSPNIKRPTPIDAEMEKYVGVVINNIPKEIAKLDIVTFLKKQGLPGDFDEDQVTLNNTKNGATLKISPIEN
jgi:hypothetical protein